MPSMADPIDGDPRKKFGNHRERGPRVFKYTTGDVARLARISVRTLRNYQTDGIVRVADLESVIRFVAPRLPARGPGQ